mmetsp:Transcript_21104/g.69108  ORF Transcript_21104/g.69108 Transcript_21104/m.69108 type:complete len:542 (-) Transcript_21104:696-2321(-)
MARSLTGGSFGVQGMLKEGTKHLSGLEEATFKNIEAAKQLSSCVRTSLGPNGMNKMVINHLEKLFVTNDAATIVGELEVQHPAAKLLVMASNMQEVEVGDGTNLVVVLAGELLSQAEELLKSGLHVSEIIGGYKAAEAKALASIDSLVTHTSPAAVLHDAPQLASALRSVIASKQWGNEELFAAKIAEACTIAMPADPTKFNPDNIRVAKILGSSVLGTTVVRGMCLPRSALGTIKEVQGARVAVYGIPLDSATTETKGTVLLKSAADLKNYNDSEEAALEKTIKAIRDTGVNLIVCGQAVGELALHFCEKFGILVLKCPSKFELRRICRTTGAANLVRLEPPAPDDIGSCARVYLKEIGSTNCTILEQEDATSKVATIVVRGSSPNIMDDVERAIDDGVHTVKAMTRDARFVAGAGGCELQLADLLQQHAEAQPGLDQYAINKYGLALEVVPRTLAENAGLDAANIVAALYAAHKAGERSAGVNVVDGQVDATTGVLDLLWTKKEALRQATDAAVTVLRVDQIIMSKPAGGPKKGDQPAM